MQRRVLIAQDGLATESTEAPDPTPIGSWVWIDIEASEDDIEELIAVTAGLGLDQLSAHDAAAESDLSKVDDFGHHLYIVLHGLRADRIDTYEVDVFLTDRHMITVHKTPSPTVDALWAHLVGTATTVPASPDEAMGMLADLLTRRLLAVGEEFNDRIEELIGQALDAEAHFLSELMAVRLDLAAVRRVVYPQRETLDALRTSGSPLITPSGRRRLSDAFDVAVRASQDLDVARAELSDTLEAYRGAESRRATDVTRVLTVYAAIMLPLSLVVGYFGMNFPNLPGIESESGWVWVTIAMVLIAAVSVGVFVASGWIRRPSGRRAGATLGRGLIEAAKAPVHIGATVYSVTALPIQSIAARRGGKPDGDSED